ncbi:MAG: 2OG-Fe(II) oxygenase [Saprospiraceae bacterium]|nr:2OG-Fe(II) oxygenase [Saprospiraceae bacterium]MCF8251475.1 2OG-Fe(II) oxygenase [Saprospiraceae bacterium]MCF8280725.1 2OG-Fe(II) oxygenase [Bacteroidales bacterium]MCF8313335.1 2OG-Fe(II) oxygenase [Saprospiraceae bacterium]MCF8441845.1 2OG-Fe(II) oxygenase [Saprospiraceae bacterium]
MSKTAKQLLALLNSIQGSGSFATSGDKKFTPPGLHIEGLGEVGFPINDVQAKAIIQLAKQAPYGKGSKTLTDTAVRKTWEIDARQLSFQGDEWEGVLKKILKKVKKGLGIEKQPVTASLYKLLIYEKGGFFKTHKDSEKEPGMFGTLVIGLPARHTGGELLVRFEGREETFDFSAMASEHRLPFAAFFADCDHELLPVTSGHRVCLVYNLLQPPGAKPLGSVSFSQQAEQLVPLLKKLETSFENKPLAVLLGHQYTPANFSLESLKHHDRPRAEALMEAAGQAGYFAGLGLVSHYLMGELEEPDYGRRSRYRSYEDRYETPDGGTMGEVYESHTSIEHWSGDGAPTMGTIRLGEDELLTDLEIGDGDPTEEQAEGYTGNAGMTIEYWYHYGAVILWPKSKHAALLTATPIIVRLEWLKYYLENWGNGSLQAPMYARQLVEGFSLEELKEKYSRPDSSALASTLLRLRDEKLLLKTGLPLLGIVFDKIQVPTWVALLEQFKPAHFGPVFQQAAALGDKAVLDHFLGVLIALAQQGPGRGSDFVLAQLVGLPEHIRLAKLHKLKEDSYWGYEPTPKVDLPKAILEKALLLAQLKQADTAWAMDVLDSLRPPPAKRLRQWCAHRRAARKAIPGRAAARIAAPSLLGRPEIPHGHQTDPARRLAAQGARRQVRPGAVGTAAPLPRIAHRAGVRVPQERSLPPSNGRRHWPGDH